MLAATLAVGAAIAQPASAGVDMERQARKLRTENRTLERLASLDAIGAELKAMPGLSRKGPEHQARHALAIGIDDYEVLPRLRKAVGDSKTIASTLVGLGFEVTRLENLGIDAFDEALDGFYERLVPGDIAFVFYAGHGVALDGVNFLLPSDMPEMKSARSSRLERYAVDAGGIVDDLRTRGVELAFVVFDACRNNPFPQDDQRGAVAMAGLQRMTPKEGAFVIYSAGIGQTALDRLNDGDTEPNSVFTRKFWQILNTPGLPVVDIAKRTQVEVAALAASVDHEQAPAYYDEVIGQFYFQPPRPRLFGLAVGIDEYGVERINLDSSVNDALLIGEALRNAGAVRVETLTDYNAHRDFIRYVWRDLLEEAQPGDTIVFAYSGHAAQEPDSSATPEADGKTEIMLVNGPGPLQWDPETNQVFESRKITDDELTAWMGEAADRNVNVVLLFDGCHGGGMLDREFANVSFIGSSQEDETSTVMVRDGRRHGTASLVFANAIAGAADFNVDGFVTQRELFAYVDENVFRMRERQNPKLLPPIDQSAAELALFSVTDSGLGRLLDLSVHWRVPAPKENDAPAR